MAILQNALANKKTFVGAAGHPGGFLPLVLLTLELVGCILSAGKKPISAGSI